MGMSIKRVLTVKTEVKVRWPQVKPEQDRWHLHGKIKNTHSV